MDAGALAEYEADGWVCVCLCSSVHLCIRGDEFGKRIARAATKEKHSKEKMRNIFILQDK